MADSIYEKVLAWAHGKLRQQVGRGECWDFADQALRSAGARSSTTVGPNDDYVWGKPVRINDVAPGDVLQFRNWIVTTKTEIVVRFADGSGYRDTDEVVARRPHHTAIVKHIGGGGVLQVYEQHVKPLGNRVQLHDVPTKGSPAIARLTHKLMKADNGKMKMATVNTVTTIVVSGSVWAYRPQAK
jgi:hypothetical protein